MRLEHIVWTGTKVFMAIGALDGQHYPFIHDLESFLSVLLWIFIHWNSPGSAVRIGRSSSLKTGIIIYKSPDELAGAKIGEVAGVFPG